MSTDTPILLDHLFRREAGRIVARLTRLLGPEHLQLAEDSVQGAMLSALQSWPYHGIPENAAAWLHRSAHNAAIDGIRRTRMMARKEGLITQLYESAKIPDGLPELEEQLRDDELRMIFMCCHPELPGLARVALSLKTVGGFSVQEIAAAFLADDAAIAQRLVRAKKLIRDRRLSLDLPRPSELRDRMDSVLEVVYLIFNEGYQAHDGEDLIRQDLCDEALRLGLLLAGSSVNTPAVDALVALMALQAARLPARTNDLGDLVLLEEQDRRLWNQRLMRMGFDYFDRAMTGSELSEYHAQAAIAATYARSSAGSVVEWGVILELYDQLAALSRSPVVTLNRAVALAKVHGPAAALSEVDRLAREPQLRSYHLLLAVRGHLLLELGHAAEAAQCFQEALQCRCSEPERRFLARKLEQCRMAHEFREDFVG